MLAHLAFNSKIRISPPPKWGRFGGGDKVWIFSKVIKIFTKYLRWVNLTIISDHKKNFKARRIFYARRIFCIGQKFPKIAFFEEKSEKNTFHVVYSGLKWFMRFFHVTIVTNMLDIPYPYQGLSKGCYLKKIKKMGFLELSSS